MTVKSKWVLTQLAAHLPAGRVLCINAEELPRTLPSVRNDIQTLAFSTRKEAWLPKRLPDVTAAVLGWSPSKELVKMQLAMLAEKLDAGTQLLTYGPGETGIASSKRLLADNYSHIEKIAFGSHAQLWRAELATEKPERGLGAWESRFVVEVANIALRLVTLPGVFSHGELDEGTRFLLENMPLLPPKARVHDFGCGCGIIGTWLKLRQPTLDLTLSDVDALAFASAKATLASNRLLGVPVHLAEGLAPIPGPLDIIVSNPPFHQGQRTDRSVVTELITTARKKLRRGGKLIVVANRFLPYKADMEQQIGPTRILADSPQFWVLETTGK